MERQEVTELDESLLPSQKSYVTEKEATVLESIIPSSIQTDQLDEYAEKVADYLFDSGYNDFDISIESDNDFDYQPIEEETYDGDNFYEEYGVMGYLENDLWEAEYQGRTVKLNKPMRGDVKKFKVYVKDPKTGNVKKVNFGDPDMKIKKSNPERRRSFRARHNCDNPGPKTKARYWSCRAW